MSLKSQPIPTCFVSWSLGIQEFSIRQNLPPDRAITSYLVNWLEDELWLLSSHEKKKTFGGGVITFHSVNGSWYLREHQQKTTEFVQVLFILHHQNKNSVWTTTWILKKEHIFLNQLIIVKNKTLLWKLRGISWRLVYHQKKQLPPSFRKSSDIQNQLQLISTRMARLYLGIRTKTFVSGGWRVDWARFFAYNLLNTRWWLLVPKSCSSSNPIEENDPILATIFRWVETAQLDVDWCVFIVILYIYIHISYKFCRIWILLGVFFISSVLKLTLNFPIFLGFSGLQVDPR